MLVLYIQLLWQRVAILGILFKCRLQNTQHKLKISFRNVWVILFFLRSLLDHLPYKRPDTPLMIEFAFGSHLRKPIFLTFFCQSSALCYLPIFVSACLFHLFFVLSFSLHLLYVFFQNGINQKV